MSIAGGLDRAETIPGAKMLVIECTGDELPEAAWPQVIDAVVELARQGD